MTFAPTSRLREFMRLTLARVESLPRWSSPQWNSLWSYVVVEGVLAIYLASLLLVVLRLADGASGIVSLSWVIWCVLALAMLAAWSICRGLDHEEQTQALRDRLAQATGVTRFKERTLGVAFLLGGVVCLGGASYFATR